MGGDGGDGGHLAGDGQQTGHLAPARPIPAPALTLPTAAHRPPACPGKYQLNNNRDDHQPAPRVTPTLSVVKDTEAAAAGCAACDGRRLATVPMRGKERAFLVSACCSLGTAASFSHCKNVQLQIFAETGIMVTSGHNQAPELS